MFYNFARLFPQQQAQLDTLLANEQCTLETIFDADNILQEIKGQGANKFAEYLIKNPEEYQKMILYIITYEEEYYSKKKQIQYPFISSEVLGSENQKLIDYLFDSPEEEVDEYNEDLRKQLFPSLMNFLEQDIINVTSAGYFNKAVISIIRRRGYNVWQYINYNPQILSNIIKHIDSKHVSEIVEKLIILDTQQEGFESFVDERKLLLNRVLKLMKEKSYSKIIVENISEILCEITSKCMNNIYYNNNEMIPFIDEIKQPQLLFDVAIKTQCPVTYQILINLVELMSKETNKTEEDEVVHNTEQDRDFTSFEKIIPELPKSLLQQDIYANNFESANRIQVQPFGLGRIRLLKLISALVQINDENINKLFVQQGQLIQVLEIISIQYPNNNQIHVHFDKIIRSIVESNQSEIIENLFFDANLLRFIACNHVINNQKQAYIGILTQISNYIIEKAKTQPIIQQAILKDNEWNKYCQTILKEINEREKPFLCNVNPKQKDEPLDDDNSHENVLEIIRKFHPHTNKNSIYDDNQKDDDNDYDNDNDNENNEDCDNNDNENEMIQEDIQNQYDDPQLDQIDQQESQEYMSHRFWQTPIDEDFAQQVENDYK